MRESEAKQSLEQNVYQLWSEICSRAIPASRITGTPKWLWRNRYTANMPVAHLLLALLVVFVWGTNFVVIKLGLVTLPPLLFAALRFAFSALPWMLFIKRPKVSYKLLAAFGTLLGAGQFGLMFIAMKADISPGLASLVIQMQVFFTIGLSIALLGERIRWFQVAGLLLAIAGIAVLLSHMDASLTVKGLVLVLLAALSWACANMVAKHAARQDARLDMLAFMVWSSAFAVPPLLLFSLALEGPAAIEQGLIASGWVAWGAVLWQATGNTLFGYAAWNWLLARYPAATVTPVALLVPVFGMSASALWLGESLAAWKLTAGALVMVGLMITVLGGRLTPAAQPATR
jgi:O-acetylserine/cysteine efflux transporter